MFAHGETVTILTATPVLDPYSDEQVDEDWSNPAEQDVPNVLVADGGSVEDTTNAANTVDSDFDLIFQPPLDVVPTAGSRVVVRGLMCNVAGRPFRWAWAASGGDAGLVVKVKIREGG